MMQTETIYCLKSEHSISFCLEVTHASKKHGKAALLRVLSQDKLQRMRTESELWEMLIYRTKINCKIIRVVETFVTSISSYVSCPNFILYISSTFINFLLQLRFWPSSLVKLIIYVGFEVITAVTVKNAVFWDAAPCKSCKNRRFRGMYRFDLQGRRNIRDRENRLTLLL
jgi:hypothetical protein